MSTPDASVFTRRKRDLAMVNGKSVNPIKSRASAFFFRASGAVSLPNFLSSPRKNRQLPPSPNRITLGQSFLARTEVRLVDNDNRIFYVSKVPSLFTASVDGNYSLNYIGGTHGFIEVLQTSTPETYLDDLIAKAISPGEVFSLTGGQVLALMLESETEGREVNLTITKVEQPIITLGQPFLAKAEVQISGGVSSSFISKVPALFTAPEAGNYKLNFIAFNSNFVQVLRTTTPQTFIDDAVDEALRSNDIILLTAGQVLPLMYLSASGIAETTLTITKVEAPSNVITLGQPFLAKAEAPVDTGEGIVYVSTVPALFTAPSPGAYSLNYTGGTNIFLQVSEETTPASLEGDIVRGFPPGNIAVLTSGDVLPLMLQSLVQDTEISLTITQQELISDITKSAHTLVTYNDYDWRVSNTPSDFTASRDGVYVLNFNYPSTRVRKVSQNTTPQTTFDIDNESLDDPPINVYLESGDVFYFMTYYDAQDGERGTNVIVTRRPVFTGSLVENQEELIPCKTAVALNIDQPELYQTDFIGDYFTTATSFSFEAPRDGQYVIFQPGAKTRGNFIPLARVLDNTTAITLENHQTEIIEDFNSIFNLTQGQKIYLMPIASTEGEILSVIISEFSGDFGPGPDAVPDPDGDDDF